MMMDPDNFDFLPFSPAEAGSSITEPPLVQSHPDCYVSLATYSPCPTISLAPSPSELHEPPGSRHKTIIDLYCSGMQELPEASDYRARVNWTLQSRNAPGVRGESPAPVDPTNPTKVEDISSALGRLALSKRPLPEALDENSPLFIHLSYGLAYTTGSALGQKPPTTQMCLGAFLVSNKIGLTAGSRAWSKHAHRSLPTTLVQSPPPSDISQPVDSASESESANQSLTISSDSQSPSKKAKGEKAPLEPEGWWGKPTGSLVSINERSLAIFWKIMNGTTWRNLHWLPHEVLVYEIRVPEGYGMRWSQDLGLDESKPDEVPNAIEDAVNNEMRPWKFRGFLEPQMEHGHDLKWKHPI